MLILLLVALLAVAGFFAGPVVADLVVRGARLTRASDQWDDGDDLSIAEDPEDLAAEASEVVGQSVTVDEYALARMVRSEEPRGSDELKAALVHTAMNDASTHGWTILHVLTLSSKASRSGFFGNQTSRRYSTKDDPYDSDLAVVRAAMADHFGGIDPTGGAVKFVNKGSFTGANTYEGTVAAWAKDGLTPVTLPGIPSKNVFFVRGAA